VSLLVFRVAVNVLGSQVNIFGAIALRKLMTVCKLKRHRFTNRSKVLWIIILVIGYVLRNVKVLSFSGHLIAHFNWVSVASSISFGICSVTQWDQLCALCRICKVNWVLSMHQFVVWLRYMHRLLIQMSTIWNYVEIAHALKIVLRILFNSHMSLVGALIDWLSTSSVHYTVVIVLFVALSLRAIMCNLNRWIATAWSVQNFVTSCWHFLLSAWSW